MQVIETEECIPCCDYCVNYIDDGGGLEKRDGFAGIGNCKLDNTIVTAGESCDFFQCSICNDKT